MLLFAKNTEFDIVSSKVVKDRLHTQTFTINDSSYDLGKCYFQGEIKNIDGKNLWDGYGKLWTPTFKYSGEFKEGLPHGNGTFHHRDIDNLNKEFVTFYKGEFKNGMKEGKGKEIYYNKESYCGFFNKSLRHGKGILFASNGSEKIQGYWDMGYAKGLNSIIEYWDNGNIKYKGGFNGKKPDSNGVWCYPNGSMCFDGIFDDGKAIKGYIMDKNGMKIIEGSLINDDLTIYHENGNKFLEISKDKENNIKEFYLNGQVKIVGKVIDTNLFNFSKYNLIEIVDYVKLFSEKLNKYNLITYSSGTEYFENSNINSPKVKCIFNRNSDNQLNGEYQELSDSGLLTVKTVYKNGKINGLYKSYYENGKPHIEANMEDGIYKGSYKEFANNDNSSITKEGNYIDNILKEAIIYNANNQKVFEGDISSNGKYINQGKLYYDNESNSLKYEGGFINSKYNGNGNLRFPNGHFCYQGDWVNGRKSGQGSTYYESTGSMEYLGDWLNDEKHGSGTLFNENGEQVWTGSFHYNEIQIIEQESQS